MTGHDPTLIAASLALLALGCSSSGSEDDPADADSSGIVAAGGRVGGFDVALVGAEPTTDTDAFVSIRGMVRDGPVNSQMIWELADETGDCQLLTPRTPFCDEPCAAGSTCVEDNECSPDPNPVSVGSVTLEGIQTGDGAGSLRIDPMAPNHNYLPTASVEIPYPPFEEGAEVRLAAEGGDYGPFAMTTAAISPLEVLGGEELPLERELPLALHWTPPGAASGTRVEVEIDISHHGGARGMVVCNVADTGSFDVPAPLVTRLIELGYAGFPTVAVTRRSRGSTEMPLGRVDLDVLMTVVRTLSIPGLVSCNEDADCDAELTCQSDRTCG